jgi:hypothetical protein
VFPDKGKQKTVALVAIGYLTVQELSAVGREDDEIVCVAVCVNADDSVDNVGHHGHAPCFLPVADASAPARWSHRMASL